MSVSAVGVTLDKTNVSSRTYYSGITIFKLIGSIMIMAFHIWTKKFYVKDTSYFVSIGRCVVPIFFLISGYLLYDSMNRRDNPKVYLEKRIRNYLVVFFIMQLVILSLYYVPAILSSGVSLFMIARYIGDFFLGFTFPQLWFLPPFILGTLITGMLILHKKEKKYFKIIIISALISGVIYQFFQLWKSLIPLNNEQYYKYLLHLLEFPNNYILNGVFLIYAGMYLSEHKEKLMKWKISRWILPLLMLTWAEAFIYDKVFHWDPPFTGFMAYPWGLFFTAFILKVKKPNIEKYGNYLNLFSILTFFLHIIEDKLLGNALLPIVRCLIIILMNIVLTFVVTYCKNLLNTRRFMFNNKFVRSKNEL